MKTFVEIGSCDFNTLTHLSHHGWRGVIVEPIKKYFDNIPTERNIQYVNAAVDWEDGGATMWTAPDEVTQEDRDFKGMSTIHKSRNDILSVPIEVKTISFKTLFDMTGVNKIDYLKIDTEGYDGEILKMFPWDDIQPNFIQFESKHIDIQPTLDLLKSKGYHCEIESENTFAIKL